ncbi:MAG: AraC family transcriptional regulator [Oscillospiraceae bacterium]|nr:AraC family transcriptional regulator [Oscillospiraceae bacterium]
MDWISGLNQTIEYIESHLTGEISYEQLARLACCSSYHYQRMFAYMTGITLGEYIRRRKMSLAAVDLQAGEKVVDTALKYGYQSPTAFSRAFQSVHGTAPSAVRNPDTPVKAYPPLRFTITIKGVAEMEYRIEKRESFRIVGLSVPLDEDMEKNFKTVPALWEKATADGTLQKLVSMIDSQPDGILGVSFNSDQDGLFYCIAAPSTQTDPALNEYTVPAATWAIFPGSGAGQSIQELEQRIVAEWLPSSGYVYGNGPDIEVYLNADPQNMKYEVWIPVVKKAE